MEHATAAQLFERHFPDAESAKNKFLLTSLPEGEYERVSLSLLNPKIAETHRTDGCYIWAPKGSLNLLKKVVRLAVYEDLKDCQLIFFHLPDKRSNILMSLKGQGHKGIFFSRRRMNITVKMVHKDCSLIIGENTYIGGARVVLLETTATVAAGGLWSDEVLLQGSDSHGIVDLDTMSIINWGPAKIDIGRRVWLGRRSSVMKNVTIGQGSVVASGAIVTKDVPPACIAAGVPAKVVRTRVSWSQSLSEISRGERIFFNRLRKNTE
ncbi:MULTISPECIES: acyltransferase [Paracoccus]|uniref:acyltransferase n=1 Tax=Paracoccus TaxID=265 RepID=UPI000225F22E|nr:MULTISPECIES: acyltransferase [Paracoccus]